MVEASRSTEMEEMAINLSVPLLFVMVILMINYLKPRKLFVFL